MLARILAATVAGAVVYYIVGFVLFAIVLDPILLPHMNRFPGLIKEPMPDMLFLPLWNLAMAFLIAYIFERWAGIRTVAGGLKAGVLIAFCLALIIDLDMLAFMNMYKDAIAPIIVIAGSTLVGTLSAGAIAAVLGFMDKRRAAVNG